MIGKIRSTKRGNYSAKRQLRKPVSGNKCIVALDVDSFGKAKSFIDKLHPRVTVFKVGSQLFTSAGPRIIEYIRNKGAEVFLDLKFHDIPNTVAGAVRQAVRLEVKMFTVHISGGREMIAAAAKAAREESRFRGLRRPFLIGVTVLTSQETRAAAVLKLAKAGLSAGLDGVVCSAREARLLRRSITKNFIIITPGIRPKASAGDDQKRTATAQEALDAGSDFLVIGRPILEAPDPVGALASVV